MKKSQSKAQPGFTIVELLVVIVVIGVLAAITIVSYTGISQRAVAASLQSDLASAVKKIKLFQVENEVYPSRVDDCPSPASGNMCLEPSSGNNFAYQADNSTLSQSFYLHASNADMIYRATDYSGPTQVLLVCPVGFIAVPGSATYGTNNFCVMKYEAKQASSTIPVSRPTGTPWTSINQTNAIAYSPNVEGCTGCHLITEAEWLTIAQNVLGVDSNWSGGSVGSGYIYSGHNDRLPNSAQAADSNDNNGYINTGNFAGDTTVSNTMVGNSQRRTLNLSNGEVIWDLSGNMREWTSGQTTGGQPGVLGGGFAYREWNAVTTAGSLSVNPYPSNANPSASAWTYVEGIGQIYSSTEDVSLRGFVRGANWDNTNHAGIFTLVLQTAPSYVGSTSFRVAK